MELKLIPSMIPYEDIASSNRTFMELKLVLSIGTNFPTSVLIVPLWN